LATIGRWAGRYQAKNIRIIITRSQSFQAKPLRLIVDKNLRDFMIVSLTPAGFVVGEESEHGI
jgi:hypothetical protein